MTTPRLLIMAWVGVKFTVRVFDFSFLPPLIMLHPAGRILVLLSVGSTTVQA